MAFKEPETSKPIELPAFKTRFGRLPDGNYTDGDLQDYVKKMPLRPGWLECGTYAINADMDVIWNLVFSDKASLTFESVKATFEHKLDQQTAWFEPTIGSLGGRPVLAERKTVFESKFSHMLVKPLVGMQVYHFELQKTFLTLKAENALVVETLSMATGFKIAEKYSVRTMIELY